MADRFYRDIELPDFTSPKSVANPDAGFIQLYGLDGKLIVHNSSGETLEVGAGGSGSTSADEVLALDDISSLFNGTTTQFTIKTNSENYIATEIPNVARIMISVGGIMQQPDQSQTTGFYVSGGTDRNTDPIKINFIEAPKAGYGFYGVVIKSTFTDVTGLATKEEALAYALILN